MDLSRRSIAIGRRIGSYLLIERVGIGGMGEVYKARHEHLNRLVAIKFVYNLADEESVKRFHREMQAVGQLPSHPHVILATDAGDADGIPYLVMELAEGIGLADLIKRQGPLPINDACELARQAACGLVDQRQSLFSSLVFSVPSTKSGNETEKQEFSRHVTIPAGTPDDGFLQAFEIFDLDLNTELVVLSSCSTGVGELHDGDSAMRGTVRQRKKNAPAPARLANTADEQAFLAAQYWAGFVLIGDWR
ncbi:MAG TPA: CHAT domain-containing protein [Pirellulaceae bacterium]|nr:CHAT domain-containing protein [Pirellulaceae bacterium]